MTSRAAGRTSSDSQEFSWADAPPDGTHVPVMWTDGGPFALHDYACPVCLVKPAVRDMDEGLFQPCWACQRNGWRVTKKRRRRWWSK